MSASIVLREITAKSLLPILRLELAPGQEDLVAPNSVSIAQAHFEPKAWFRGIYLEDEELTPVGFVMLEIDDAKPEYYLWRLMIAKDFQRRGFGKEVIDLVVEHVREHHNATELKTSYVPAELGPEDFYKKLGFEDTGEVDEGEHVCLLKF